MLLVLQIPLVTPHKADQAPVLATFRIVLLPDLQEVLVDQANHVKSVGHDGRVGEVLPGDTAVGFRQVHDDHLHRAAPP